ncbi:MAG TPA: hypothetical protein VLA43_09360, partial [Longimicrobiales bacterium]|nr:hypothetical protein [Longimicrobiales bacterium]
MVWQRRIRYGGTGILLLVATACASAPNPWRAHDQGAHRKALASDLDRPCPVVVANGTDQVIEALVAMKGEDRSLGLLGAGQSVTVGVDCKDRRVHARAVAQTPGLAEGVAFRKSAVLDVLR